PSAGGGGKGMRVVRERQAFGGELEGARREAKAAFGDDRVLLERYLERPRHIEMQVFGDSHGNVLHLFERDCSVQRRHQKAIEARIYAEDPEREFLPSTGRLVHVAFPPQARVDTGVEPGAEISPWYDPMIAKLIVHGEDRASALARLISALGETQIAGVTTNVEFLRRVCESTAFAKAELDTG